MHGILNNIIKFNGMIDERLNQCRRLSDRALMHNFDKRHIQYYCADMQNDPSLSKSKEMFFGDGEFTTPFSAASIPLNTYTETYFCRDQH